MIDKDYAITINTSHPGVFAVLAEWLDDVGANWDGCMTHKGQVVKDVHGGSSPRASAPVAKKKKPKPRGRGHLQLAPVCMIPDCGCSGEAHP